jgi:tetratricopeptide (TPR) repeat protein
VCAIALTVIALIPDVVPGQKTAKPTVADDASALIRAGKADSAMTLVSQALSSDSANVKLLLALADIHKSKRQMNSRRAVLDRVLKLRPRSIEARIAVAEDFLSAKQLDSAGYFAQSAVIYSNRRSADAYYWVGRVHHQAGRADSAVYYYREAMRLLPAGGLY